MTDKDLGPLEYPEFVAALEAGAPWWLALEAIASTRLDKDTRSATTPLTEA